MTGRYVTVLRDPMDRAVSHFLHAAAETRSGVAALLRRRTAFRAPLHAASAGQGSAERGVSVAEALGWVLDGGPCLVPDAGFDCWDSDYYVQVCAGGRGRTATAPSASSPSTCA